MTFLRSEITPTDGGDTHFADTVAAYEALPASVKDRVSSLIGQFTYLKYRDNIPGVNETETENLRRGSEHTLISIHPRTGIFIKVAIIYLLSVILIFILLHQNYLLIFFKKGRKISLPMKATQKV